MFPSCSVGLRGEQGDETTCRGLESQPLYTYFIDIDKAFARRWERIVGEPSEVGFVGHFPNINPQKHNI